MSFENFEESPDGDLAGIEGIEGIDHHLDRVEGRDLLPHWLRGITINSAPATIVVGLITEYEEATARSDTDDEAARKVSDILKHIDIFRELHEKHRVLIKTGTNPIIAVGLVLNNICRLIEQDKPPFNGYDIAEWESYIWKVANAYKDFYSEDSSFNAYN